MRKITDTLSKEIVAVCEGEIAGIVTNAYADKRLARVRGYKLSSEDRDEGRMIPLRRLLGEGDALVVKDIAVAEETSLAESPIGAKVFDTAGLFLGVLRDLRFDEGSGVIHSLIADEKELSPDRVVSFGKSAVILRAPCHDGKLFRKKASRGRARPKNAEQPSLPVEFTEEVRETLLSEPVQNTDSTVLYPDYAFLLGRTVLKRIGSERDVIARENEVVTAEVIEKARERGKLVELTVNSRK